MSAHGPDQQATGRTGGERGSALVMAIFVLVLLTTMGASLLFVSETEMKSGVVDLTSKKAFYVTEAGLEDARETLRVANLTDVVVANRDTLDDELVTAAGANGAIDFNADTVKPVYASDGTVSGFTGYGDDVPLKAMTSFGGGVYAAFLTNDSVDGKTNLNDTNNRAMITAIGVGPTGGVELVQAIVERAPLPSLPATITILGPSADFNGGNSNSKKYIGNDCNGSGVPGLSVPVLGVIGTASEAIAGTGVIKPGSYISGGNTGLDTVNNIQGSVDPQWMDCSYLHDLARSVRAAADVVGDSATPTGNLGSPGNPRIVYIEGDYDLSGGYAGAGLLWVTGTLTMHGNCSWAGTLFVVGKGDYERTGAGNGAVTGATLVADVAGPDGTMWTTDDCAGPDGLIGTSDDGTAIGHYQDDGGGTGDNIYCSSDITAVEEEFPFGVVSFRER
ncbi:MAG TPA: pilus assembly PilX N-terminal domain-containing protein [Patescibacteria group bacterium]|nr:pilus assembly PilX N-terminal domain-containing protein [Patescibacteria group bacterium]